MANVCILRLAVFLACGHMFSGELYSSMGHIKIFVTELKRNMNEMRSSLGITEHTCISEDVQRLLDNLQDLEALIDERTFTPHHPLDAIALFRQVYNTFTNSSIALMTDDLQTTNNETYTWLSQNLPLPYDEVFGTLKALLSIQAGYNLSALDIAHGDVRGFVSKNTLKALDCQELMMMCFDTFEHKYSWRPYDWLEVAESLIANGDTSTTSLTVNSIVASILEQIDCCYYKEDIYQTVSEKGAPAEYTERKQLESEIDLEEERKSWMIDDSIKLRESHDRLCQGMKPEKEHRPRSRPLTCSLVHNNHPLLILRPIKMQQISYEPFIVEYFDVLTEADISYIKANGSYTMTRSMVIASHGKSAAVSRRTSKSTVLDEDETNFKFKRMVDALTGLSFDKGRNEKIQLANYGVGGRYYVHADYYPFTSKKYGNRIGTFMIYLSDVESGGATVFPNAGEAVFPEKGKAVFWYNLLPDGSPDGRTNHAACPVAVGDKWITTYWINTFGQEFTKPCGLAEEITTWY